MIGRLALLVVLAFRNLRSHYVKTLVVMAIVALGTFVLVVGLSLVSSMEAAMERSITSSLTGHIQVWSSASEDELSLVSLGSDDPDLGELQEFAKVESQILELPGVKAVVPMAMGTAMTLEPTDTDRALENLRRALESDDESRRREAVRQVQTIAAALVESYERELTIAGDRASAKEKLAIAREVATSDLGGRLDDDPAATLQHLDTAFAPLSPEAQPLFLRYLATDPQQYAQTFDGFRVVDGEMIPPGRRGLMVTKKYYELVVKHPAAVVLDELQSAVKKGAVIAEDATLQSSVRRLKRQGRKLALQIDAGELASLRPLFADLLGGASAKAETVELLENFFSLNDENFQERRDFFYEHVAPTIELYAVEPGDEMVLRSFTKNGYLKAVKVRLYGTFEFEGLESAGLSVSANLIDLVTFREMYGKMSPAQLAELRTIQESVELEEVTAANVEDALFGEDAGALEFLGEQPPIEELVPESLHRAEGLEDRVYDPAEMRSGVVTSAAVILEDPARIPQTIRLIEELPGLQATDWRTAGGIVGKFVAVMSAVLYVAVFIIFLVSLFIINNSLIMMMIERTAEIGTIRAIGGQRAEILMTVVVECALMTLGAALAGTAAAVGLIEWLGATGIPAPTEIAVLLFGGDRLFPTVSASTIGVAFGAVLVVTLLSSLYPARVATQVHPIVAMRGS